MDKNRALEIMQTEKCCVERNEASECDRYCGECDLVLPTAEVIEAYDLVIALLRDKIEDDKYPSSLFRIMAEKEELDRKFASREEPVGEWIHEYDENDLPTFKHKWRCPVCGETQTYGQPPHCPDCGARLNKGVK